MYTLMSNDTLVVLYNEFNALTRKPLSRQDLQEATKQMADIMYVLLARIDAGTEGRALHHAPNGDLFFTP